MSSRAKRGIYPRDSSLLPSVRSRSQRPKREIRKPRLITATLVRIQARKVRSLARYSVPLRSCFDLARFALGHQGPRSLSVQPFSGVRKNTPLAAPGAQDGVLGRRCRRRARRGDQAAARQPANRRLDGTLGEARLLGELPMADPDLGPAPGADAPPEGQVHEKRGGRPVVADQVGHQAVENVAVEPDYIDHNYSIRNYSKRRASRFFWTSRSASPRLPASRRTR